MFPIQIHYHIDNFSPLPKEDFLIMRIIKWTGFIPGFNTLINVN